MDVTPAAVRIFSAASCSLEKSRFTCTVAVRFIISCPSRPCLGRYSRMMS